MCEFWKDLYNHSVTEVGGLVWGKAVGCLTWEEWCPRVTMASLSLEDVLTQRLWRLVFWWVVTSRRAWERMQSHDKRSVLTEACCFMIVFSSERALIFPHPCACPIISSLFPPCLLQNYVPHEVTVMQRFSSQISKTSLLTETDFKILTVRWQRGLTLESDTGF